MIDFNYFCHFCNTEYVGSMDDDDGISKVVVCEECGRSFSLRAYVDIVVYTEDVTK